jgi:hypothetical protein
MKVAGVGFDVDVFVVEAVNNGFAARQLDNAELTEHLEFIKASEEALRKIRDEISAPPGAGPPVAEPPKLVPEK